MEEKKLAIIVPIYNVADYLKDCLNSLLKQGVPEKELQIIFVDDGSTDNSAQIAQKFVEKYPNFFELHQFENAGLGAARNRGTRLARARFITYVDSDDIVAPNSYEYMLGILERTGSQIITGNVHRFNSKKEWLNNIHARSHLGDFENTSLKEHPELIWDSTSWNKIFCLDFLKENNLYFPEGVLYEDIPMINPAFAAAKSIDIVKRMVYLWRAREGSITESSTDAKAVLDRITITEIALAGLKKYNAPNEILDILYLKSLNLGIISMLRKEKYEYISLERKQELFNSLKEYLEKFPSDTLYQAKFDKLIYFDKVLKAKTQEEFDEITSKYLKNEIGFSGYWNDAGQYVLKSDYSDLEKIVTSDDLEIHPKIEEVVFEDDSLKIQGYFYAKYSDMSAPENVKILGISALSDDGNTINEIVGEKRNFENQRITAKFGYNLNHFVKDGADFNYDYSGYELKIPLNHLEFETTNSLAFVLEVEIDGLKFEVPIKNPISGDKPRPKVGLSNAQVFSVSYKTDWSLVLSLKERSVEELYFSEDGKELRIKGNATKIALKSGKTKLPLKLVGGRVMISQAVQEKIKSFDKSVFHWWQFITYVNGKEKSIYYSGFPKNFQNDSNLEILFSNNGVATLGISYLYPLVEKLQVEENVLKLAFSLKGWMTEATKVQIVADPTLSMIWETEKMNENLYQLSLPLTLDGFSDKEWLNFHVRLTFNDGYQTNELLRWGKKEFALKNEWVSANGIGWFFRSVEQKEHGAFAIKRTADRVFQEKVGNLEYVLQEKYQNWLKEPVLNDYIMMSSFWGRNNHFNDNPEALYRYIEKNYPNMTTIIVLKDAIRSYPEYPNAKIVSYGTADYWYYLARSKYFVNINFTEPPRIKREEQIEIQTMHGTPLKTLGFDVLGDWKDSTYNEVLRKNGNWDYLTVPSDWVANYALKAFRVSPQIIKSGYPRNDKLFIDYKMEEKNVMKLAMGLPIGKKIVAYTPTWRDKDETSINNFLNVQEFYSKIPENTVIAIKNHHYQSWKKIDKRYADKIILLDSNTEIEQLYHISDALITDYSSVMFDYSLLNKPMIFWVFDYETYVKNRGLNFDFIAEAPGPVIFQQSELSKWIENFNSIPNEFSNKIQSFRNKFGQYDSGDACEIILKKVLND